MYYVNWLIPWTSPSFRNAMKFPLCFIASFSTLAFFATGIPASYAQENHESSEEQMPPQEEMDALDQELQFLHKDAAAPSAEVEENTTPAEKSDQSLADSLADGLKSLFSDEGTNDSDSVSPSTEGEAPSGNLTTHALLQGLNKITARTSSIDVAMNEPFTLGTLEITVHSCWQSAPEEANESKVLMEIWEQKPGEEKARIFNGWMFSSSPSISALENPVYDVTVVKCYSPTSNTPKT